MSTIEGGNTRQFKLPLFVFVNSVIVIEDKERFVSHLLIRHLTNYVADLFAGLEDEDSS